MEIKIAYLLSGLCLGAILTFIVMANVINDDMNILSSQTRVCIAANMSVEQCVKASAAGEGN